MCSGGGFGSGQEWGRAAVTHRNTASACEPAKRRLQGPTSTRHGRSWDSAARDDGFVVADASAPHTATILLCCLQTGPSPTRYGFREPNCSRASAVQKASRADLIEGGSYAGFRRFAGQRP
jgi:hypothetical protein